MLFSAARPPPSPLPKLSQRFFCSTHRTNQTFTFLAVTLCAQSQLFLHVLSSPLSTFHSSFSQVRFSGLYLYSRSSYKVCHCHIKRLHKKLFCRNCASQGVCEFCAMGPTLAASSPHKQKLRVLCLHGFRTSGKIMETQLAKLDRSVLDLLDMVFLDGSYLAQGKSEVEGFFDPPFYEWFQFERTETDVNYSNLNECIQFISDFMEKEGPFEGLVGFSQGSFLAAALAGMQQQGLALTTIPALQFVMIISGGVLYGEHAWKGCYSKPIRCPSVHLIGEKDFLKPSNEELLLKFENPIIVRHAARHTVPRLDATAVLPITSFLEKVITFRDQKHDLSDSTMAPCAA